MGYKGDQPFAAQSSQESPSRKLSPKDAVLTVASNRNYTSPRRTFLILIVGIFLAEVISMIVISLLAPSPYAVATLLDALLITALIIPLLYFLSLRPLLAHIESGEKKERELQKAVERLQELEFIVNQSPAVAFLWRNAAGRPVEFVSANVQEYGYSPKDFLDREIDYASVIYPEDRDVVTSRIERFIQEGWMEFEQEYRIVTSAGDIRWVDERSWIRRDEAGALTHHQGIVLDITERKRAEEALVSERQRLFNLLDELPAYVFLLAPDYQVRFANRQFREFFGQPQGKPCYHIIYEREEPCADCTTYSVFETNKPGEWERSFHNGTVFQVLDYPFTDVDGSSLVLQLGIDITQRKRAAENLRRERNRMKRMLDAIPDGVYIVNQGHDIEYVNPVIEREFGPVAGHKCYEYLHDRSESCARCTQPDVSAGTVVKREWYSPKTGKHYELFGTALRNADDSISKMEIVHDVTERIQAREQLEQTNLALQALSLAEIRQRQFAEGLVQVSIALNSSLDLDDVLNRILEQIQTAITCVAAAVALVEDGVIRVARAQGIDQELYPLEATLTRLPLNAVAPLVSIKETGEPIYVPDTSISPDSQFVPSFEWVRSYVAVPLYIDEHTFGFQCVLSDQPDAFGPDVTEQLMAFANHAVVAINNARLFRAELKARDTAEVLGAAVRDLNQNLHLATVADTLLKYLGRLIPYDSACIALVDSESHLVLRAANGYEEWARGEQTPALPLDSDIDGHFQTILREGQSVVISNTQRDPRWEPRPGMEHALSWLGIPLSVGNKVIGVCGLDSNQPRFFTEEHVHLGEMLVGHAAAAVHNAWLFEEVLAGRERLQYLTRRLVEVQENERAYIARELHDEAGQLLSSLKLGMRFVKQDADCTEGLTEKIRALGQIIDAVLDSLHRLAMDLRPAALDHLGLVAALGQHMQSFGADDLQVHFRAVGFDELRLPTFVETAIYRTVQEALVNVTRHARASHLGVFLERRSGRIRVFVEDDGVGFDPGTVDGAHLGLLGMQERAEMLGGTLTVDSTIGSGTTIIMEIPDVYPSTDH
jgi:PAS domain S-box-containing protein